MLKNDIIIVMPTKNPSKNMAPMIETLINDGFNNIVVVDDGCGLRHKEFFDIIDKGFRCDVIRHATHLGKGRSLKNAFNHILINYPNAQGIITIDDIVKHSIDEVKECASILNNHPRDMILGCRDYNSEIYPFRERLNNKIKKTLIKILTGINVSDTSSGLRGIPIGLVEAMLSVEGEGMDYELNTLLYSKKNGISIREFLVSPAKKEKWQYNPLRHSLKVYWVFLSYCMTSVVATIIDFIIFTTAVASLKMSFPTYYIVISTIIARVVSSSVNYYLSKNTVFKKNKRNTTMMKRFFLIVGIQMILSAVLVSIIYHFIPITETIVKMIVDSVLFVVFYQVQREWVFNEKKNIRNNRNIR